VELEWDERKRTINVKKHGFDFVDAGELFNGYTVTMEDDRFCYNEQRFFTLGTIKRSSGSDCTYRAKRQDQNYIYEKGNKI